jgi:hypothetical protein
MITAKEAMTKLTAEEQREVKKWEKAIDEKLAIFDGRTIVYINGASERVKRRLCAMYEINGWIAKPGSDQREPGDWIEFTVAQDRI